MHKFMKYCAVVKLFGLAAGVIALVGLTANTASAHHPAGKGGRLVVGVQQDITGFDPIKAISFASSRLQVLSAVYERLFDVDGNGKIQPLQAVSATPSDDFKKWRIKLRQGMKFSNGEEFTSEALTVHWDRLIKSRWKGRYTGRLMGVPLIKVAAIDKYTVDFIFKKPHAGFLNVLAAPNNAWWV